MEQADLPHLSHGLPLPARKLSAAIIVTMSFIFSCSVLGMFSRHEQDVKQIEPNQAKGKTLLISYNTLYLMALSCLLE